MKKLYTLSLFIISLATFAQAVDPFLGTGVLNANGWITHSGATPGQMVIVPGSLSYPGLTTSGNKTQIIAANTEDVNLASSAPITGVAYYSAIINVLNTDGLSANADTGNYFLTFGATAGASVTGFNGRVYIKAGVTTGTVSLGVLNGSGGTATPTYVVTDLPVNTSTFVVMKFDIACNTASLFINPLVGVSEIPPTVTNATGTTAAPTQIATVAIRQGATTAPPGNTGNVEIDEVRLGSTWEFVTSANLSTNQNSISGLKVYPNPVANGVLYITSENNNLKVVNIYDVLGKLVLKTVLNDQSVNVSNLKGGVYIVKITEDGKTATRKLVIR